MVYTFSEEGFKKCREIVWATFSLSKLLNHYCESEIDNLPSEDIINIEYCVKELTNKLDCLECIFCKKLYGNNSENNEWQT